MSKKIENSYVLVCPECMCSGSYSCQLTVGFLHLTCNECESLYSLSILDMNRDFYDAANDAGFLIADNVVN